MRLGTLPLLILLLSGSARAEALRGTVRDAQTGEPIPYVTVIMDKSVSRLSTTEGVFDFGAVSPGRHTITFNHIAYETLSVTVEWPGEPMPLAIVLEPTQYEMRGITVRGDRTIPSLPTSAVTLTRDDVTAAVGNVANDPLRTLQAQPSAAAAGVDFLSALAVRGGDSEEHRVYFDGYALTHYAHVGGFSGVVYDDLLESTTLVPGAAPIRYNGALSGVVLMEPARPDTNYTSFRYDLTSMGAGTHYIAGPTLTLQASGKTSFFNLPAYQQVGVRSRSFRDFTARAEWSPRPSLTITPLVLFATDGEVGLRPVEAERNATSLLAGVRVGHRRGRWTLSVRPSFSYYDSSDDVIRRGDRKTHDLRESKLQAEITRQGAHFGITLAGEAGTIRHEGTGGSFADTPVASSAEVRALVKDAVAVTVGAGGSREPWTDRFEPEAYGSVRVDVADVIELSAGARRSHQTPFVYAQRRFFASVPVDPGELQAAYAPTVEDARAVSVDQISAAATLTLPARFSVEGHLFKRWYENLLTWEWDAVPDAQNVGSNGSGEGDGYEIVLRRSQSERLSLMAAISRARVRKREGTLTAERPGDFDRPFSWQAAISMRLTRQLRLTVRWMDTDGRPYTDYDRENTAPATSDVNAVRLRDFKRLDAKLVYEIRTDAYEADFFLDMMNLGDRKNVAMMYAYEFQPEEFTSSPYGGTRFFPIAGVTVRF